MRVVIQTGHTTDFICASSNYLQFQQAKSGHTPERQLTNLERHHLFSRFFTWVIKKGAHQIARARESSLGLQARMNLKLTAGVKGAGQDASLYSYSA